MLITCSIASVYLLIIIVTTLLRIHGVTTPSCGVIYYYLEVPRLVGLQKVVTLTIVFQGSVEWIVL